MIDSVAAYSGPEWTMTSPGRTKARNKVVIAVIPLEKVRHSSEPSHSLKRSSRICWLGLLKRE